MLLWTVFGKYVSGLAVVGQGGHGLHNRWCEAVWGDVRCRCRSLGSLSLASIPPCPPNEEATNAQQNCSNCNSSYDVVRCM